jgi:hypothetical protein
MRRNAKGFGGKLKRYKPRRENGKKHREGRKRNIEKKRMLGLITKC